MTLLVEKRLSISCMFRLSKSAYDEFRGNENHRLPQCHRQSSSVRDTCQGDLALSVMR